MNKTNKKTVQPVPASIREDVIANLARVLYSIKDEDREKAVYLLGLICRAWGITRDQYKAFLEYNVKDEIDALDEQEKHAAFCDDATLASERAKYYREDWACEAHHAMWAAMFSNDNQDDQIEPEKVKVESLAAAKAMRAIDLRVLEILFDSDASRDFKIQEATNLYYKYNKALRAFRSSSSLSGTLAFQNCIIDLIEQLGGPTPGHYMGEVEIVANVLTDDKVTELKRLRFKEKPFTKEEEEKYGERLNGVTRLARKFYMPKGRHLPSSANKCLAKLKNEKIIHKVKPWQMVVDDLFDIVVPKVDPDKQPSAGEIKHSFYEVQA